MTLERRRATVTLHPGNYESELAALLDKAMAAQRAEETGAGRRMGTRSEAIELAKQYDALLAEAEASGVEVTVWAISYTEWGPLADEHPPREDNPDDKVRGVNMKTFPHALLMVSLVPPGTASDFESLKLKGEGALGALGEISRVHYAKLETAAWNVNVGDDALPKFSLVSLLKQQRDPDSKPPSDLE